MFIPQLSQVQEAVEKYGTPLFVTDADTIRQQANHLLSAFSKLNTKVFYAMKANFNPQVIKVIKAAGIHGIDAVSPNEVRLALELGYLPDQIVFTPSNPSDTEMLYVGQQGILQNLGSISEVERYAKLFPGGELSVRICPEVATGGEFDKITTGHKNTKFGIMMEDIPEVKSICERYDLKMVGIHSHIGSGFYAVDDFKKSVEAVCYVAKNFADIKFVDFGGGFGVNYKIGEPDLDLSNFAEAIEPVIRDFESVNQGPIETRVEPGKFLVSASTVFLMRVTTIKQKGDDTFVGCDAGFGQYIRPAMYGAFQDFINLSNPNGAKQKVQIVGNVCETCDVFNQGLELPLVREGDILAMVVAGGYAASQAANYNLRERAAEVLLDKNQTILTRKRDSYTDILQSFTSR